MLLEVIAKAAKYMQEGDLTNIIKAVAEVDAARDEFMRTLHQRDEVQKQTIAKILDRVSPAEMEEIRNDLGLVSQVQRMEGVLSRESARQ